MARLGADERRFEGLSLLQRLRCGERHWRLALVSPELFTRRLDVACRLLVEKRRSRYSLLCAYATIRRGGYFISSNARGPSDISFLTPASYRAY